MRRMKQATGGRRRAGVARPPRRPQRRETRREGSLGQGNLALRNLYPGLDRPGAREDFNSLDAQREASEAYIKSQAHEGWRLIRDHYSDGGYSGGSMDRPALQKLLVDVRPDGSM